MLICFSLWWFVSLRQVVHPWWHVKYICKAEVFLMFNLNENRLQIPSTASLFLEGYLDLDKAGWADKWKER